MRRDFVDLYSIEIKKRIRHISDLADSRDFSSLRVTLEAVFRRRGPAGRGSATSKFYSFRMTFSRVCLETGTVPKCRLFGNLLKKRAI
jgi:hypothetical protein